MENSNTIPIPLPRKMLWKITLSDSLETPKTRSVLLVRGAQSLFDAATKARSTEGFAAFQSMFPKAEIVGAEYAGCVEN